MMNKRRIKSLIISTIFIKYPMKGGNSRVEVDEMNNVQFVHSYK